MKQPTIEELKELARKALIAYSPDDNLGYRKDLKDAKLYNVTVGNMAHFANSVLHPTTKHISELWKDHESCLKIFNCVARKWGNLEIKNSKNSVAIISEEYFIEISYAGTITCRFDGLIIAYNTVKLLGLIRELGYDFEQKAL